MNRRLIALNIALLAVLAGVTIAGAQPGTSPGSAQLARPRGEYTMISGRIQGATTAAIYVLDAANQEVVALGWDRSANKLETIGWRSLSDDAKFLKTSR